MHTVLSLVPPSHAQYSLGDFSAASSAFERGLKLEPGNAGLKSGLQNAKARLTEETSARSVSPSSPAATPSAGGGLGNLSGMADMLRGMGGAGGGGMPDLASIMNNPQMMAMAQQMAANGGLESLMSNPAVANMVNGLFYCRRFSIIFNEIYRRWAAYSLAICHRWKRSWAIPVYGRCKFLSFGLSRMFL